MQALRVPYFSSSLNVMLSIEGPMLLVCLPLDLCRQSHLRLLVYSVTDWDLRYLLNACMHLNLSLPNSKFSSKNPLCLILFTQNLNT